MKCERCDRQIEKKEDFCDLCKENPEYQTVTIKRENNSLKDLTS